MDCDSWAPLDNISEPIAELHQPCQTLDINLPGFVLSESKVVEVSSHNRPVYKGSPTAMGLEPPQKEATQPLYWAIAVGHSRYAHSAVLG